MAYNPFDFFRKHQKVLFAVVTVIIMFVFVLQAGVSSGSDFFQSFPRWLAQFQTHGPVVAKIDGSDLKKSQVDDVGRERGLANGYMTQANDKVLEALKKRANTEATAAGTKELRETLQRDENRVEMSLFPRRLPNEVWPLYRADVASIVGELDQLEKVTLKSDDKGRVRAVREYAEAGTAELSRRMASERGEGGVYFANQPNRTDRDRLEFLLWKKKADQLGIRYTHEDVDKLVQGEFPVGISPEELKGLMTDSARRDRKADDLYDALADEFRVRAAQTAVMGVNAVRYPAAPPVGTTRERYDHFVNETTATKYTLLTIPVEAYLAEVEKKLASKEMAPPTEAELTKIFNDASTTDPDPSSPRAGVREPRKVGVQWIEVTGDEDYFKDLAAKREGAFRSLQGSEAAKAVFGGTVPPAKFDFKYDDYLRTQGAVAAYRQSGYIGNQGRPGLTINAQYQVDLMRCLGGAAAGESYRDALIAKGGANVFAAPGSPEDGLTDSEFVRADLMAALTGLTASALATNGPSLAPVVAVTEAAYRQTREQRAVAGIQAFLVPTLDGPARLAEVVSGAVAMQAGCPTPLPPAAVQPVLNQRTVEMLRTEVATADVQEFQKELARITGQKLEAPKLADRAAQEKAEREFRAKTTAEAAKYVKGWIDARKVKTGTTTEPRAVSDLASDPGLGTLLQKDFLLTGFDNKPRDTRAATSFGHSLVSETEFGSGPDGGFQPRLRAVTGLYQLRSYDPMGGRQMLRQFGANSSDYAPITFFNQLSVARGAPLTAFWRTAEVDPVRPLSLGGAGVREKCVNIWKLNKARELARQAADAAAATIRAGGESPIKISQQATQALEDLKKPFAGGPVPKGFDVYDQTPEFTVAKMLVGPEGVPGSPPPVTTQFQFNPSHRAIVYPTEKLRDELIAKKDSPLGTTFVVADQPERTLLLLVVAGRDQKGEDTFRSHVLYPLSRHPMTEAVLSADALSPRLSTYVADADHKAAVDLLKAEFNYTETVDPKTDKPYLDAEKK